MKWLTWLRAAAASMVLLASVGFACSPVRGYRVPTNIELIENADLVVLARVRSGGSYGDAPEPRVILHTIRTLKGSAPPILSVEGMVRDRKGDFFPLEPTPLDQPHPSSLWGACVRQAYHQGGLVVAIFNKTAKGHVQVGAPFARAIEDVERPNALWVRAADLYARILVDNEPAERRSAFVAERNKLLRSKPDRDAQAIAADIDRYLKATAKRS